MNKYLLSKKIVLVLILFGSSLAGAITHKLTWNNEPKLKLEKIGTSSIDIQTALEKWPQIIKKYGGEKAYKEFKDVFKNESPDTQHAAAHLFGSLLYKEFGVKGFSSCDQTFAFGCYHGFFTKALSENNVDVIKEMDKECIKKFGELGTGCQHGIGHGITEYFGHKNIIEALETCRYTTQKHELFGCTSGVFMEYNVPLIISEDNKIEPIGPRTPNKDNPYEPCNTIIPEKYKNSCYFEMPQWWNMVFNRDYSKIGSLCESIDNIKNKESCFLGVGSIAAPESNYLVDKSIQICKKMPSELGLITCIAGASWAFFGNPETKGVAKEVCEWLENEHKVGVCLEQADLVGELGIKKDPFNYGKN